LLPVAGRVGAADDSARPFRAAQFTKPNMARAKIGMHMPQLHSAGYQAEQFVEKYLTQRKKNNAIQDPTPTSPLH
jgi:uncharacterized protein YbaP (TraB family)